MAMALYSHNGNWDRMRETAAADVSDNYMRTGFQVGTDAAEASSTSTVINATGHAASVGDVIVFTSGSLDGESRVVSAVDTNNFTVSSAFSGAPSAPDAFSIITPIAVGIDRAKVMVVKSTLNQGVYISFDGSVDHLYIEAGDDMIIDLKSNNLQIGDKDGDDAFIHIKADSSVPTTGKLFISTVC